MDAQRAVRDSGIVLDDSPELTRLRLRSRAGWTTRIAFGLLTALVLGPAVLICTINEASYGSAAVAACIGLALPAAVYLTGRWSHRQGVLINLTPDKFAVRKHWSDGGESLELFLNQVRLEETRREIVVRRGMKAVKFGSALTAEERHSVVVFLNEQIARHLHHGQETARPATPEHDSAPGDDSFGTPLRPEDLDRLALALRAPFRHCDSDKVHLAPAIPQPVLTAALVGYLDLQDDEILLAIVGADKKGGGGLGCALTTRRIYWRGKAARVIGNRPACCQSLDYAALPETIGRASIGGGVLDLGERRRIILVGDRSLVDVTTRYLVGIRSLIRGEVTARGIPDADRDQAQAAWHRVLVAGSEARALQDKIRSFHDRAFVVSRPKVTPALVVACVAVYAAMVTRGVSAFQPSPQAILAWGANFGPSVVFDREFWRPFTSMFLHLGLIHLLLNMFCLATAGPVVERFFGHLGFAALYILSGIGGAFASLAVHPTLISAGASGAIFGIFGGLLGYLVIRHREVPGALLKPMRSGALAFIGYNTLFGLSVTGIDTMAHLGGLASGFACGLVLTAVAPATPGERTGLAWLGRRAGAMVVLAAALAGLGAKSFEVARVRILSDPKMGPSIRTQMNAAPAWNSFFERAQPVLAEFDRIGAGIDGLFAGLKEGGVPKPRIGSTLDRLEADCQALGARISDLPAANPEIGAIRSHMVAAQRLQLQILEELRPLAAPGDGPNVTPPGGLDASIEAYTKEFATIKSLSDAYLRTHHLTLLRGTH